GHQPVLDIDLPGAGAGTIHTVCGADNLVMLPAPPISLLPGTVIGRHLAVVVGKAALLACEIGQTVKKMTHSAAPRWILAPSRDPINQTCVSSHGPTTRLPQPFGIYLIQVKHL